jgi:4-hydroxythreonine-4-phosphate dehydrogenase
MTAPLVLTCGEPAGIAPEITAQAWSKLRHQPDLAFVYLGDAEYLARRAGQHIAVKPIADIAAARAAFADAIPVLHRALPTYPQAGVISPATAKAVISAIDEGVSLARSGRASALVTNPIQKEALYHAGFAHQGHTDYLASLCAEDGRKPQEVMMLVGGGLRAVPITVHVALKDAARLLTKDAIVAQALVVASSLKDFFGIARPRLMVTGLNPHAGENGAMGSEEQTVIAPAITELKSHGLDVSGPIPADTAFSPEMRATYDAILCMYHDQALIPVKTLDFHGGVNVTLGLPLIRTSPDHGTALGLAGKGKAQAGSLIAAIELAARMAARRG